MMLLAGLSVALGALAAVATLYLGLLTLLSGRVPPPTGSTARRFTIVVPAHNEAEQIGKTVRSLRALDYPADKFAIVVVADNCSDATASEAAAAGATVLQRTNEKLRGKGYALELAFAHVLQQGQSDAVVVVDADTLVSQNLLQAFGARLVAGEQAIQAEYGVSNPDASWRTRLMTVALAMFHRVRSLGRERLGVSAGLRGNGMCFSCELLRNQPHRAFGLVEDVEYGLAIGQAGVRVAYADEAKVFGEMVSSAGASQSQRQRWEGGRLQLVRQNLPGLLAAAWRKKSALLLDLALDIAVPPLSYLGLLVVLQGCVEAVYLTQTMRPGLGALLLGVNAASLSAYVVRGMVLSGLGWRAVSTMMWAPVYVIWKSLLMFKPRTSAWIRTRREGEQAEESVQR